MFNFSFSEFSSSNENVLYVVNILKCHVYNKKSILCINSICNFMKIAFCKVITQMCQTVKARTLNIF